MVNNRPVVLFATLVLVLISSVPAFAQDPSPTATPTPAEEQATAGQVEGSGGSEEDLPGPPVIPPLIFVMDASGSMDRVDGEGVRLFDGARRALLQMMGQLPDVAVVGLRVYGHTVAPDAPPADGCLDSELVHPVSELDRTRLGIAIESYAPSGYTPIGLSLEQAAADLPDVEGATIVLVSDGEDTCHVNGVGPDPCEVAAGLSSSGVDVTINTIGFLLPEGAAARQLSCIAEETGGTFVEVRNAADLLAALSQASDAQVTFRPEGERVAGSANPLDAPILPGSGRYIDEIAPQEVRHYGLELETGQQAAIRAVVAPREGTPSRTEVGFDNVPSFAVEFLDPGFFTHKLDELGQVDPDVPVVGGFRTDLDWTPTVTLTADEGLYVLAADFTSVADGYDGVLFDFEFTVEVTDASGEVVRPVDGLVAPAEPTPVPEPEPTATEVATEEIGAAGTSEQVTVAAPAGSEGPDASAPTEPVELIGTGPSGGGFDPAPVAVLLGLVGVGGWQVARRFKGRKGDAEEEVPVPFDPVEDDEEPADGPWDPRKHGH